MGVPVVATDLRVAVISDVHGNTWALRAVIEDIERRGRRSQQPPRLGALAEHRPRR